MDTSSVVLPGLYPKFSSSLLSIASPEPLFHLIEAIQPICANHTAPTHTRQAQIRKSSFFLFFFPSRKDVIWHDKKENNTVWDHERVGWLGS